MIPKNASYEKIRETLYHAKRKDVTLDITRQEFKEMESKGYWDGEPEYVYVESEGWVLYRWINFTIRYHLSKYMDKNTQESVDDITHIKITDVEHGYSDQITDKKDALSKPILSEYSFDGRSVIAYTDNNIYALCDYGVDDIVQFFHLPRAYDGTFNPDIY